MAKQYETVIGLEVHVELATKTKIFCGCSTAFGGAPNTHTCPVCTGMPGSLPVLNKQVVEYAMGIGLATHCDITRVCKFDRKNYFYPDNPQNYQISQLYQPIARNGYVEITVGDTKKKVRIHEMHMEEDAGKLVHDEWERLIRLILKRKWCAACRDRIRAGYAFIRRSYRLSGKIKNDHPVSGSIRLQASGRFDESGRELIGKRSRHTGIRNQNRDEEPELIQGNRKSH